MNRAQPLRRSLGRHDHDPQTRGGRAPCQHAQRERAPARDRRRAVPTPILNEDRDRRGEDQQRRVHDRAPRERDARIRGGDDGVLGTHSVEYPPVPTPYSTSPLLDDPAFPDVESDAGKEAEPAQASRIRRAWQKFKSFNWRTDLGFMAMALGFAVLMLALGVLICFGLNVICTYVGARILHYTTPIRTIFYHTVVTAAYARVAFAGCAIVNAALLVLAPTVTILVENRRGDGAATIACWSTLALGMLAGGAAAASLGIVVVPPERAPEGLGAIHALAAGSLGAVVVGIPVFVLGVLYALGSAS